MRDPQALHVAADAFAEVPDEQPLQRALGHVRDGGERVDAQRFVEAPVDRVEHAVEALGFGRGQVGRCCGCVGAAIGLRGGERFAAGLSKIGERVECGREADARR